MSKRNHFLLILTVLGLGLIGTYVFPQTVINGGQTLKGVVDNSGATHTLPMSAGTSVPGTCTVGELFFKTNATAGQNIYQCAATNVFTQQLNSGTATGGGITMYSATGLTVTANTYYLPIGGGGSISTTETNVDIDAPAAATLTNMYVQLSVALGMGNSGVFTMRKNAASQSVTCTISGASATSCNDTAHSFAVSQGDLLTIQLVTTGTIVVTPNILIAAQFGNITATGTVNSGTINQVAYYAAGGTAVSGETILPGVNGGGLVLIEQHAAASQATLDFTTCISSSFDEYLINMQNLISASNNVNLELRVSTSGSFDAGNNYAWSRFGYDSGGSSTAGNTAVSFIQLATAVSSNTSYGVSGTWHLSNPGGAIFKKIYGDSTYFEQAGTLTSQEIINGVYKITTAVDGFRFLFSAGNIASGTVRCYGIAKT